MMFGYQARLPIDLEHIPDDDEASDPAENYDHSVAERLKAVSSTLITCRNEGLANLKKAQKKQKAAYALKHPPPKPFEVGDKVSIRHRLHA